MEPDDNLQSKVRTWLEKTGYPLEMRVTAAIGSGLSGAWEQEPNLEYVDPDTGESRETDYYLDLFHIPEGLALCFRLVIECKNSTQPWVVFKRDSAFTRDRTWSLFDPGQNFTFYAERSDRQLEDFLNAMAEHLRDRVHGYPAPGYAVATAFKTGNIKDPAHDAVRQVLTAAVGASGSPQSFADDVISMSTACPIIITT